MKLYKEVEELKVEARKIEKEIDNLLKDRLGGKYKCCYVSLDGEILISGNKYKNELVRIVLVNEENGFQFSHFGKNYLSGVPIKHLYKIIEIIWEVTNEH